MGYLIFGLQVAFIGLAVVFITLYGLTFVINAIEAIVAPRKKTEPKAPEIAASPAVSEPVASLQVAEEEEIPAVLAAAVMAFLGRGYKITAIRRLPGQGAAAWSTAGRNQVIGERLSMY